MADAKANLPALDDVDSGWEDEEDEEGIDLGWGDPAEALDEPALRGLTPEERSERLARAAARKERQRAKAAEKSRRRKERSSVAASRQKKSVPRARAPRAIAKAPAKTTAPAEQPVLEGVPASGKMTPQRRPGWQPAALVVVAILVVAGVGLLLWRR